MTVRTLSRGRAASRVAIALPLFATLLAGAPTARAATITLAGDRGASCVTFPGTSGGTHSITVSAANVMVGQTLVLTAGTTGNASLSSMTDTAGNTYTGLNSLFGSVGRVFHWGGTLTAQLNVGQTVTLTYVTSTAGEVSCASIHAFNNVAALPGSVDQTGTNSGTSAAPGATLTAVTTQPNELLVETHIINGAPGGTGSADNPLQQASSGTFFVLPYYRIVSATGTFTISGTLGNSLPWQAAITSMRDVVFPVDLQRFTAD